MLIIKIIGVFTVWVIVGSVVLGLLNAMQNYLMLQLLKASNQIVVTTQTVVIMRIEIWVLYYGLSFGLLR